MLKAVSQSYQRRRFAWLFFSLLFTLGVYPALKALAPGFNLLDLLLAVNLLAAIASLAQERAIRVLLLFGVAFLAVRGIQVVAGIAAMFALGEALWVLACVLATGATARYALRPGVVDSERIFAALDAYLLAGLVFGVSYWVLEQTWPGSFGPASLGNLDLDHAVYFSFVTIATLGYGDVVPVSNPARGLAILEAVGGQMYLAVLVARLVSLYSVQADR
jgi:hypothetical protein